MVEVHRALIRLVSEIQATHEPSMTTSNFSTTRSDATRPSAISALWSSSGLPPRAKLRVHQTGSSSGLLDRRGARRCPGRWPSSISRQALLIRTAIPLRLDLRSGPALMNPFPVGQRSSSLRGSGRETVTGAQSRRRCTGYPEGNSLRMARRLIALLQASTRCSARRGSYGATEMHTIFIGQASCSKQPRPHPFSIWARGTALSPW